MVPNVVGYSKVHVFLMYVYNCIVHGWMTCVNLSPAKETIQFSTKNPVEQSAPGNRETPKVFGLHIGS
ncbi:hypothetical protein TNCV_4926571 [Trichonephila clavipes]|nr:hypothetical protein TNCV_4926571 [Trichonephila clavipes]